MITPIIYIFTYQPAYLPEVCEILITYRLRMYAGMYVILGTPGRGGILVNHVNINLISSNSVLASRHSGCLLA